MLIRRERDEDRAAVYELNVAAFGTPAEADLVERLRRDADPCISLVAESAGRVVGHICFSPVTATNHPQPGANTRMMGLAPMAVADWHRNQGVGSALVREGLKRCAQAGFGAVVVLGHPGYYPRFGFRPAALYNLESEYDSPPEAFMAIELEPGFLSDIRGIVSYHPAFKSLDETPETTGKQDSTGDFHSRGNDDTTATSRLEDELRKSEAVRQAVWESALDAIITMDSEGTILDFNPAAERIFGHARSAAIGQKLDELIVPAALREGHRRGLQRYLATGESRILNQRMELPALRADGSEFPVELTVVAVTGGEKPYFIGSIRDITERKRSQEAVLREQHLSDQVINSLPGLFYLLDENGRFLRWNKNLETVTGYTEDEIRALNPLDLVHGAIRDGAGKLIGKIIATGEGEAEGPLRSKDGRTIPYFGRGRRIEVDGRACIIGVGMDMSALRQAEAERDRLFNLSRDLFCVSGLDGYIKQLNPAWQRVLGYSSQELMSRPYIEFVHPEDRERTIEEIERQKRGGASPLFENRLLRHDGSFIWASWSAVAAPEEGLIYAVARDDTERIAAERTIRESEDRYRSLVESARDGIFSLSADGLILSLNTAVETISGWKREDWIGKPFQPMVHPEDLPRAMEAFAQTMQGQNPAPYELRILAMDGTPVPMEFTVTPQRSGGQIVGILGIARDIRERKHLEEHLRQIQKLDSIGRLAAGIAHDFNNLLTVQQGYLSLLLMESGLPAHIVESLQEVAAASERAADLTRQLLLFSRKQVMQRRNLNLNEVIVNISKMLGRAIEEHITLRIDCDGHLPPVNVDPGMIEQVLMNLVVNARDAMPKGGRITISTEAVSLDAAAVRQRAEARSGRFVILTVADTGSGIAPEVIENIFEPFFTTKDVGKGTGLGLATVHGIVKQHEGWIEVESAPGKGAVFRIYLPVVGGAADALEPVSPLPSLRGGSETILAVEDEDALREILKMVLERYGYRVLIASSGIEALELWCEHAEAVDLLLTDMVMPHGLSGRELAERLRAERTDLKVLVMSGYDPRAIGANEGDVAATNRYRFLQKPYVPSELIRAVRECLDGRT